MGTIQQFQIRKIYAMGHALGIVDPGSGEDGLHVLVGGVAGKDSVKNLTYAEAAAVIARLEGLQGKAAPPAPSRRKPGEHPGRSGGVTSGQQKKIWALMYELKKYDAEPNSAALGDRLCGIIRKETGMDAVARDPFAWMSSTQGNRLIEILKNYVASAGKKGKGVRDDIGTG
ncbi:MAG: regulatory protein GemA [Lachnospiraceae bacterium]|nr:regulatory protein GemA [Lachnospiraceae bacterium]MCM1240992.1 regulatory protein GemA [Lachnospiraceae bacterium]